MQKRLGRQPQDGSVEKKLDTEQWVKTLLFRWEKGRKRKAGGSGEGRRGTLASPVSGLSLGGPGSGDTGCLWGRDLSQGGRKWDIHYIWTVFFFF